MTRYKEEGTCNRLVVRAVTNVMPPMLPVPFLKLMIGSTESNCFRASKHSVKEPLINVTKTYIYL